MESLVEVFVCVQTLLGCLGFGLTLMNTSSCSISDVMHCGSTSMSSLMSNISTRGRQPCRKHQKKERERVRKVFLHKFYIIQSKLFRGLVGSGPKSAQLQFFSSDPSPPSHVKKENSGRSSMRQAFSYRTLSCFFFFPRQS